MSLAASVLSFTGFGCLALSMPRHWRDVFAHSLATRTKWLLRLAGWFLLAASVVPCIAWWGTSVGIVVWCGILTVAALAVALLLTYGPRARPEA